MTTTPPPEPPATFQTPDGRTWAPSLTIGTARRLRAAQCGLDLLGPDSIAEIIADELKTIDALAVILDPPDLRDFEHQLTTADPSGNVFCQAATALAVAAARFFRSLGRRDQAAEIFELAANLAAAAASDHEPPPPSP